MRRDVTADAKAYDFALWMLQGAAVDRPMALLLSADCVRRCGVRKYFAGMERITPIERPGGKIGCEGAL